MSLKKTSFYLIALAFFALLAANPATTHAQVNYGSLRGTVSDTTDRPVAEKTVTLINSQTGREMAAVTDKDGQYVFTNLEPSSYTVKVEGAIEPPAEFEIYLGQNRTEDIKIRQTAVGITTTTKPNATGITGQVIDENQVAVTDIQVRVTSEQGVARVTTTDQEGFFAFTDLEPSAYTLEVFRTAQNILARERINLIPLRTASVSLVIKPEGAASRIKRAVEDVDFLKIPPLNVKPELLGVNVTKSQVRNTPDVGGISSQLTLRVPGTTNNSSSPLGVTINGNNDNTINVNGIEVTSFIVFSDTSFQDTSSFFNNISKRQSLEQYKEFRVDPNNQPAAFGTGTGGKVMADTLKGGDQFRGDVYWNFTDDAVGARNFFDPQEKPDFRFSLGGASVSGPLSIFGLVRGTTTPRAHFFLNYEGIRASSSVRLFESVPSDAARARAVPSIAPLLDAFTIGGAIIVPGASSDPDLEVVALDTENFATKHATTLRFEYQRNENNFFDFLYQYQQSRENTPEGATGRRQVKRDVGQLFVFGYLRTFKLGKENDIDASNKFIFGFNNTPTRLGGRTPALNGADLSEASINITGSVTPTGIPGQPLALNVASPGGLLQRLSGRGLLYTPYSFTFNDVLTIAKGRHTFIFGGEFRLLRTYINILNGTTYRFASLNDFLQNRPSRVDYLGDLGAPSVSGASGESQRQAAQEYYIGFAQDTWQKKTFILNFGLRYEYYTPVREIRDRAVVFDIRSGTPLASDAPFFKSSKLNFSPRVAVAWTPWFTELNKNITDNRLVLSASFGIYTSPGASLTDKIKPIESDRINVSQTGAAFPINPGALAASFFADQNNRQYQVIAHDPDYSIPERVYKYDASIKLDLIEPRRGADESSSFPSTKTKLDTLSVIASYVGQQGRNLLLRNFANRIIDVRTNPNPTQAACFTREFDIPQPGCLPLRPFGEIDFRASGGKSSYDAFQFKLQAAKIRYGLQSFEVTYTLARSYGNTNGGDKTLAAGNTFDYDYDLGYNLDDARHKFTVLSVFDLPFGPGRAFLNSPSRLARHLLMNWRFAAALDVQSGQPIDVRLSRPDIVYVDASGRVFNTPAADRSAVINVPGGGSSLDVRRPDLIPGVNPYLDQDRNYLNPAAFAIPAPGTFGNLKRGQLRGVKTWYADLSIRKQVITAENNILEFRVDISNLFNFTNFDKPVARLPGVLGMDAAAGQLQPGQPFTAQAAGMAFGVLNRTVKRAQDFSASRQILFGVAFRFNGGTSNTDRKN